MPNDLFDPLSNEQNNRLVVIGEPSNVKKAMFSSTLEFVNELPPPILVFVVVSVKVSNEAVGTFRYIYKLTSRLQIGTVDLGIEAFGVFIHKYLLHT